MLAFFFKINQERDDHIILKSCEFHEKDRNVNIKLLTFSSQWLMRVKFLLYISSSSNSTLKVSCHKSLTPPVLHFHSALLQAFLSQFLGSLPTGCLHLACLPSTFLSSTPFDMQLYVYIHTSMWYIITWSLSTSYHK